MTATAVDPLCLVCGIPVDAGYFDSSSIREAPTVSGAEVVLATFELHPSYCGVLQYFAQYTDAYARSPVDVRTPNLEWQIRRNGQPLAPWLSFDRIINAWGISGFPIHVRLEEGCLLEFVVRFVGSGTVVMFGGPTPVNLVGGRLLGRYWYNPAYGGH